MGLTAGSELELVTESRPSSITARDNNCYRIWLQEVIPTATLHSCPSQSHESLEPWCDVTKLIGVLMTHRIGVYTIIGNRTPEPQLSDLFSSSWTMRLGLIVRSSQSECSDMIMSIAAPRKDE
jgi:hypothetical protein